MGKQSITTPLLPPNKGPIKTVDYREEKGVRGGGL